MGDRTPGLEPCQIPGDPGVSSWWPRRCALLSPRPADGAHVAEPDDDGEK